MGIGARGDAETTAEKKVMVRKFPFRVQFVWQPKSATDQASPPAAAGTRRPRIAGSRSSRAAGPTHPLP